MRFDEMTIIALPRTCTIGFLFVYFLNSFSFGHVIKSVRPILANPNKVEFPACELKFFVEFRGAESCFRIEEFKDVARLYLDHSYVDQLVFNCVIPDVMNENLPLCAAVMLPSISVARSIARKCACVRSISRLCGFGRTLEDVCSTAVESFDEVMKPQLSSNDLEGNNASNSDSWRFTFRRYGKTGKSGRDVSEKRELLSTFVPFLRLISDEVDLNSPRHDFLFLEDWSISTSSQGLTSPQLKGAYLALIIADGPDIENQFSLKTRPFIGTTTMDPISSHIASNAALINPGDLVLDPFCGTGSLMVSSAWLGGRVIGSDIDGENLGFVDNNTDYSNRSKNIKFKRKGGRPQVDVDVRSNFEHYQLLDRLVGFVATDVRNWVGNIDTSLFQNNTLGAEFDFEGLELDAIVTDPPFGRRERALDFTDELPLGDPDTTISVLLSLAGSRLRPGKRLVFWLPTPPFLSADQVAKLLEGLQDQAQDRELAHRMVLKRLTPQPLHGSLWRWLCVYERSV